jgi:hypothetical protein
MKLESLIGKRICLVPVHQQQDMIVMLRGVEAIGIWIERRVAGHDRICFWPFSSIREIVPLS